MNWKFNAFAALALAGCIGAHSLWKQYNMLMNVRELGNMLEKEAMAHERLSHYEWEDGTPKVRCARCGVLTPEYTILRYGATWCKDCYPKKEGK